MSTIRTNTITDAAGTGAPNFTNGLRLNTNAVLGPVTGDAPMFACRAWVNFNGTGTVAIRAAGNVSSITDNGTGDYTVNFTTAMPDANYSPSLTANGTGGTDPTAWIAGSSSPTLMTASALRIHTGSSAVGSFADANNVHVQIFR